MLTKIFDFGIVRNKLLFRKGATIVTTSDAGVETTVDLAELAALEGIAASDLAKIDGITDGTAYANKAVVLGATKDIATITSATITTLTSTTANVPTVNATNIDAGATGVVGSVDVFPTTTGKGKLTILKSDNTNNDTTSLVVDLHGQVTSVHIPDGGAAASYVAQSTAALTLAEVDVLQDTPAGTATANKAAVLGANKNLDEFHTAALYLGAAAGTLVGSTAAQLDAAVAGTPLVYRTNVTAAQVNAGATAVVPAVAGKRFQVMHISMAAAGGSVSGPTTVEVIEETAGTVFLSHVTADLTDGTWHNLVTGTAVITGITAGGMTAVDNKALLVTKTGGTDFATATGLDVVVVGYYTTT